MTVAAFAAGAVLALSGCGAGQISQTATQVAAVNGNEANVGQVALRDVRILLPQSEQYNNAKGGSAVLAFSAINLGEFKSDELVSITSDLGAVKIGGKIELGPQRTVVANLPEGAGAAEAAGQHGDTHGAPTTPAAPAESKTDPDATPILVEFTGLTKDITPGLTYPVTFNFKENGTVVVNVPVDAGHELERVVNEKSGGESEPKPAGGH
ncbi:hypothetical protein [Nocardia sp. NPDC127526]|uniref:hypothetical protein n=1 Tax=Nocardia sp. NPDC127526 TaxID=3345393 RepID=UPI003640F123